MDQETDPEANEGRQDEADQHLGDAVDLAVEEVGKTPFHVTRASRDDDGPDEASDEGV